MLLSKRQYLTPLRSLRAGWRSLLNQLNKEEQKEFEKIHREEIADVLGDDGVWFNINPSISFDLKRMR